MTLTRVIALGLLAVFSTACASGKAPNPWLCAAAGAAAGGGAGGYIGANNNRHNDLGAASLGAGVGMLGGGILGYTVCAIIGHEKPVAQAAPPPPAPAPAPAPAPTREKIVLRGVNFDFNKADIRPDAGVILDEAANILNRNPGVKVSVEGHTDSIGTDAYNQKLSERRAKSVADYLASKGVAADRLSTKGFGESKPIASNKTEEGRALNRRVELQVME